MRKILAAALSALLCVPFPALAAPQCRTANCNHVQQAYVAPAYVQQAVIYDQNVVLVPKAFAIQVAPVNAYLGVADSYRDAHFAKQVAEELFKLNQQFAPQPGGAAPQQAPKAATSKIGQILANSCASCHMPGKHEPDLSGDPDAIPEIVRLKSFHQIAIGKMPKGKAPLTQDQFNEFGEWSEKKPNAIVPSAAPKAPVPEKQPAPTLGPAPSAVEPKAGDKK